MNPATPEYLSSPHRSTRGPTSWSSTSGAGGSYPIFSFSSVCQLKTKYIHLKSDLKVLGTLLPASWTISPPPPRTSSCSSPRRRPAPGWPRQHLRSAAQSRVVQWKTKKGIKTTTDLFSASLIDSRHSTTHASCVLRLNLSTQYFVKWILAPLDYSSNPCLECNLTPQSQTVTILKSDC